jgi:hypothetical protein
MTVKQRIWVEPDSVDEYTIKEWERTHKFLGPGWYLYANHCFLVVPTHWPADGQVWKQKWPPRTKFTVAMYTCRFDETVFGALNAGWAPTRVDEM